MSESTSQLQFGSLQESLTNSIRRAKERIYNNSLNTYTFLNEFNLDSDHSRSTTPQCLENRNRAASQKTHTQQSSNEERNALAGAMRHLQERISVLEREKREFIGRQQQSLQIKLEHGEKSDRDLTRLVMALREKEQQTKKLNKANGDLSSKNSDLMGKVLELEEELERQRQRVRTFPVQSRQKAEEGTQQGKALKSYGNKDEVLLIQKDKRIEELQEQNRQLQQRNEFSHQTIQKLMRQLQEEKRTNLRWIKLHEQQLMVDQKENSSLQGNRNSSLQGIRNNSIQGKRREIKGKDRQSQGRKEYSQLLRNNKQMYERIQRSKLKIVDMGRELKEAEERYAKLKLLVTQIVENVNKVLPSPNAHLRFLINRIEKLENIHLESLRSLSNHSRLSRGRDSRSKDRKKSLKMSDLNSSSKKSNERSAGKSSRKIKIVENQLSLSQKKQGRGTHEEEAIEALEKEVAALKRQHRNLVVRAEKGSDENKYSTQIEETSLLYMAKKNKLDELRKNPIRPIVSSNKDQ